MQSTSRCVFPNNGIFFSPAKHNLLFWFILNSQCSFFFRLLFYISYYLIDKSGFLCYFILFLCDVFWLIFLCGVYLFCCCDVAYFDRSIFFAVIVAMLHILIIVSFLLLLLRCCIF